MYCMHFRFRGVHDVMAVGGLAPLPLRFATVALIALLCLVAASCVVVFLFDCSIRYRFIPPLICLDLEGTAGIVALLLQLTPYLLLVVARSQAR